MGGPRAPSLLTIRHNITAKNFSIAIDARMEVEASNIAELRVMSI